MNVFILTDLEGIPDVYKMSDIAIPSPEYDRSRAALTKWLNITAGYCFKYGATKVYYLDGHAGPAVHNIIEKDVDKRLSKLTLWGWSDAVKAGAIDCVIELGSHARAGTIGGFLDHTTSSAQIFSHKINGREYSELALHAAFMGKYGIPTVLCIGDTAACEQAREYIPDIEIAIIKKSRTRNECDRIEGESKIIEAGVKNAFERIKEIDVFNVKLPADIEMTYYRTDYCEAAMQNAICDFERTDARTLKKTVDVICDYSDLSFVFPQRPENDTNAFKVKCEL